MSKKQQRAIKNLVIRDAKVDAVIKDLKLPDLQRQCVIRGMPFHDVVEATVLNLHSFLIQNWDNSVDRNKLIEFDVWMDQELTDIGRADLIHPMLNLGHTIKDDGGIVKKKVKKIKSEKKKKRERTEDGIFKGTKKAYTFELAKKGHSKDEVIDMVLEKFPEANEKSISIWYNKARKSV